jgi:ribonuclease P protein component
MRRFEALRRAGEIAALRRRGVRLGAKTLYGYGDRRGPRNAVAIAVAKAVGGAVVRNRIRRRVRGALEAAPPVRGPVRLLLVARPQAAGAGYLAIASDVAALLAQLESKGAS